MKINIWILALIFNLVLVGCASNTPNGGGGGSNPPGTNLGGNFTPSTSTPSRGSSSPTGTPSRGSSSPTGTSSGGGVSPIKIPSRNEDAPSGVLEQLSWAGRGGGSGGTKAILCDDCYATINNDVLYLKNFSPNQWVEIPFYRVSDSYECGFLSSAEFVAIINIQVDENGDFNRKLSGNTTNLLVPVVLEPNSGREIWVWSSVYLQEKCPVDTGSNSCPGAPPQRLKVNEMAYVCTKSDTVKLREGPGKDYPVMKSLVSGADIKIIGGPTCANKWSWWKVETESGFVGWMSEGGDKVDKYYLCPAK